MISGDKMKKKFILLILMVLCLFSFGNVSAQNEYTCTYIFRHGRINGIALNFNTITTLYISVNKNQAKIEKIIEDIKYEDPTICAENKCGSLNLTKDQYESCLDTCKGNKEELLQVGNQDNFWLLDGEKCPQKIDRDYDASTDKYNISVSDTDNRAYELMEQKKIKSDKLYCGSNVKGRVDGIPRKIPELTSLAVTIIQIIVPVILVLMGSIDLFKGITAGKEDEMKKGQHMFIKRLIVGAVVFFTVVIVKFFISIVADTNVTNIVDCIDCFISNDCEEDLSL